MDTAMTSTCQALCQGQGCRMRELKPKKQFVISEWRGKREGGEQGGRKGDGALALEELLASSGRQRIGDWILSDEFLGERWGRQSGVWDRPACACTGVHLNLAGGHT